MRTATGALRWFSIRGTLDPQQPEGDVIWTWWTPPSGARPKRRWPSPGALDGGDSALPWRVLVQNQVGTAVVLNQALCDPFGVSTPQKSWWVVIEPSCVPWFRPRFGCAAPAEQLYAMGINATYGGAGTRHHRADRHGADTHRRGDDLGRLWLAQDITERRRRRHALERLATTTP